MGSSASRIDPLSDSVITTVDVPGRYATLVTVEPLRGTRHTSARRYSYDDPLATIIAVSDDGPVSVLRAGTILANSHSD